MDQTLPQMESFDFERLDKVALEQTLAWFKENPEVPAWKDHEGIGPGGYTGMLEGDGGIDDWRMSGVMEDGLQDPAESASGQRASNKMHCINSPHIMEQSLPGKLPRSIPKVSIAMLHCTWEGCENAFDTTGRLTTHLKGHALEASEHWTRLSRCSWQGCQSKATFNRIGAYRKHMRNIHTHPMICTEARCSNLKPFRNWADLERHKETIHLKLRYQCPYDNCPSETQTFLRKDKLLKHIRETVHDNDAYCISYHCQTEQLNSVLPFTTRKEISAHFGKHHETNPEEVLRCALGSCGNNPTPDIWSKWRLESHLEDCHGISSPYWLILNCKDSGSREFDVEHFTSQDPNKSYRNYTGPWHDCTICAPQAHAHDGEYSTVQDAEGM